MIKKNNLLFLITALLTLAPMAVGLLLWDILPAQMATHFGLDGTPDAFGGRAVAVFVMPLVMLVIHVACVLVSLWDQKRRQQDRKAVRMLFWVFPLTSWYISGIMYAAAFGMTFNANVLLPFLGLLLMVIGNYLPKCRQNPTLGIKIKWTLESEENWNATHRFTGKVWFISGLVMMLGIFLPSAAAVAVMIASMVVLTVLPAAYSYRFYRRQMKDGTFKEKTVMNPKTYKRVSIISGIIVSVILIGVAILMFTGDVSVTYDVASVTVDATYWGDMTVAFADIDTLEYREHCDEGQRTNGFGSARLLLGTFTNEEFGSYTRYSYTGCDAAVIIKIDGQTLVIGGKDATATKAIYDTLTAKRSVTP